MSDHLDAQIRAGIGNSREFFQQESHRALDALLSELDAAEARLTACEQERDELLAEVHEKNAILHGRYHSLARAEEALRRAKRWHDEVCACVEFPHADFVGESE